MLVKQEFLVNFKTISRDEPLIIWINLDSSDTPEALLEQELFCNLTVVFHVSVFCCVDCSCCTPARAVTYTSKFFTVLEYTFSCFSAMILFRICKFMIITFVYDAISLWYFVIACIMLYLVSFQTKQASPSHEIQRLQTCEKSNATHISL